VKAVMGLLAAVFLCGCVTPPHGHKDYYFDYPAGLEEFFTRTTEEARRRIEACGVTLSVRGNYHVSLVPGEAKVDGMWAWHDQKGRYVGGLTLGKEGKSALSQIGCKPETLDDISDGVAIHEAGHYWLITNFGDSGHDPKYDPAFGWSERALEAKGQKGIDEPSNNERNDSDGTNTHQVVVG